MFEKQLGPLISAKEMTRCIHCTRCVRFGVEIAGVMELGMRGRGEHAEIVSFVGRTVDSELSGNMIDLCPVGALTSKPFRYAARTWELSRRKSVSPHDGLGSNLIVQVKNDQVMRVLPLENEQINECWISDKDRFSYDALNSEDRLTTPMVKRDGEWVAVDWQAALELVAERLRGVVAKHGANALGTLISPHATLEEMALAARLTRALGSDNVDFRLRQTDFRDDADRAGIPWLGLSIAELNSIDRVLVVGSFLRKDQPLIANRLRQGAKNGSKVVMLNAVDDDALLPYSHRLIVPPSQWTRSLAELVVAGARATGKTVPAALSDVEPGVPAKEAVQTLLDGKRAAILLGSAAQQHADAAQIKALAQALGDLTGARVGVLAEAANSVGGYVAQALPQSGGMNAAAMLGANGDEPRRAYVVLHAEPELDCANPVSARAALERAEFVVLLSPFRHGAGYADVMLPVAPFTETAGTFINCEGRVQTFNGVVKPRGDARPAWKVLRVLGTLLQVPGFELDSVEEVRANLVPPQLGEKLSNGTRHPVGAIARPGNGLERVADVPIYFADPLVRRSRPLQQTADAKPPKARMHRALYESLGLDERAQVRVRQGKGEAVLSAVVDAGVPPGVVRIAAAHPSTCGLDGLSGPVTVERA